MQFEMGVSVQVTQREAIDGAVDEMRPSYQFGSEGMIMMGPDDRNADVEECWAIIDMSLYSADIAMAVKQ